MQKIFLKTLACGCIIKTLLSENKTTNKDNMYLIGKNKHLIICDKCKLDGKNGNDRLHDIWIRDKG